ncbi:uncharacterized protein LOC128883737 isoform X2 [Hylaeus volcanicus]|uniref:uncharacterized protein LOC128883737 isoform X2 n=1 Tax=Hylaeus volcanicus TaxID=313075 RepID=UPI0023B7BA5A|nr:uncharacterized protein LOC128883737 isoform X2 [Hylaeus volcanicus]
MMTETSEEKTQVEDSVISSENKECETIEKENCTNNENKEEEEINKDLYSFKDKILNVEKQEEPSDVKETVNNLTITKDIANEKEKNTSSQNIKNDTCLETKITNTNRVSRLKVSGILEIVHLDENELMENVFEATVLPADMKLIKNAGRKRLDTYVGTRASSLLPLQMSGTELSLIKTSKTMSSLTRMQPSNPRTSVKTSEFGKETYKTYSKKKPHVSSFKMTTFEKIEFDNARKLLNDKLKKQTNLSKGITISSDTTKPPSVPNVKGNAVPVKKKSGIPDTLKTKETLFNKKNGQEKIQSMKTANFNRQVSLEFHRWPSGEARKNFFTEGIFKQQTTMETVSSKKSNPSLAKSEMNTLLHSGSSSLRVQSHKSFKKILHKNPFYLQSLLKTKKVVQNKDSPQPLLSHKSLLASSIENRRMQQIPPFEDRRYSLGRYTSSHRHLLISEKHSESSNKTQLSDTHLLLKDSYLKKNANGGVELLIKKKHAIQMPKLNVKKLEFSSPASAPSSLTRKHFGLSNASPSQSMPREDKHRYRLGLKKKKSSKQKNVVTSIGPSGKLSMTSKANVLMKTEMGANLINRRLPNVHLSPGEKSLQSLNQAFLNLSTKTRGNEKTFSLPETVHSKALGSFIQREHPCLTILHQEGDVLNSYVHVAHKDSLGDENDSVLGSKVNQFQAKDSSLSEKNVCTNCSSTIPQKSHSKQVSFHTNQDDLTEESPSIRSKRKRHPHACRYSDTMHQQSPSALQHTNTFLPPLTSPEFKINIQPHQPRDAASPSTHVSHKDTPSFTMPQFLYKNQLNWSRAPHVEKAEAHTLDLNSFKEKKKDRPIDLNLSDFTESRASGTPISSVNVCQRCCFHPFKPC